MSVFDNVLPNTPAETNASRTEIEIANLQARLDAALAKKAAEDAAKAAASSAVRALAIGLHTHLCPHDHASLACTWRTDLNCDNWNLCDWTEAAHARWLGIAQVGVAIQTANGWTIAEPVE